MLYFRLPSCFMIGIFQRTQRGTKRYEDDKELTMNTRKKTQEKNQQEYEQVNKELTKNKRRGGRKKRF